MTPKEIYEHHRDEAKKKGKSVADQHAHGLRMLNHAGFFKKGGKWVPVHPDLRDKVNVREAWPQPDGTYCIYDVSVFYPNAVKSIKGTPEVYTAEDIRRIIQNTNYAIAHEGGQKPGILEGHPNMLQAMNGMQMDVHGFAVNWREDPRGDGWAMCDLVHVDPEYVERLKKKKLTGLSAYIAEDNEKQNRRFGHVALLGGSTQALSHLPMHDVYAACCFSADAAFFQETPMKMSKEQCFAAMDKAVKGYSAAQASFAAKEPGADMKMMQAGKDCYAASRAFAGDEMGAQDGGAMMPAQQDVPQFDADGKRKDLPTEAGLSLTDQTEAQQMEFSADQFDDAAVQALVTQFSSSEVDGAFHGLANVVKGLAAARKADQQQMQRIKTANNILQGRVIQDDFRTFCAGLRNEGHAFDADYESQMFSFAMESVDKRKGLENAKRLLKMTPKKESLAGIETVGGYSAGAPKLKDPGTLNQDETSAMMTELSEMTGRNFSEADLKIGAAFSAGLTGYHGR